MGSEERLEGVEGGEVEGCEEVVEGFGAADLEDGVIGAQEEFGGAEASIVVEAHGVAVCAGIVDDDIVAWNDFGEGALDGELIVVLAEGSCDIVDVVAGGMFFAEDGDMVIGTIEGGAHEVGHAGIEADIVAVGMFEV